jgi:hypothetical protein
MARAFSVKKELVGEIIVCENGTTNRNQVQKLTSYKNFFTGPSSMRKRFLAGSYHRDAKNRACHVKPKGSVPLIVRS